MMHLTSIHCSHPLFSEGGTSHLGLQDLALLFMQINVRLVINKVSTIYSLIKNEARDFVCITKTWLDYASGLVFVQLVPPRFVG